MKSRRAIASTVSILVAAVARVGLGQVQLNPLPEYDPFTYPSTGSISGIGGWGTSISGGGHLAVDHTQNLSYSGLNTSKQGIALIDTIDDTNNAGTGGEKFGLGTFSGAGTTLYYSFTMQLTDMSQLISGSGGTFFAGFNIDYTSSGLTTSDGTLRVRRAGTGNTSTDHWELGISRDNAAADTKWQSDAGIASNAFNANDTYMVVGKFVFGTGASVWINPTASTFGASETSAPTPSISATTGADSATLSDFFFRKLNGAGASDTPTIKLDDLRIGKSWASVAPIVWKGDDSAWGTAANWYTGSVPDAANFTVSFTNDNTTSNTVDLAHTPHTVGGITFNSANSYTITGASDGILTLDTNDGTAIIASYKGNHTISAPVVLNQSVTVDVEADSLTISGGISGNGQGLTKTGRSVLMLSGSNSYTGATSINAGAIRGNLANIASSNLVLNGGAFESTTAIVNPQFGGNAGSVQFTTGVAGGFSASGTPVVVDIGGDGSGNGSTPLVWNSTPGFNNPSALILNASTANNTIELKNPIDVNGAIRTIEVDATAANATATISGVISNSTATAGINKTGAGVLLLTGSNTYNGQTEIAAGTLRGVDGISIPNNGGNSILTLKGGIYEPTTATFTRPLGSTANGQVRLTAGTTGFSAYGQPLSVDIGGDGTGTGPSILWQNSSADFVAAALVLNGVTATDPITFQNPLNLGNSTRTIVVGANTATMNGPISGTAGLTKTGAGALLLRNPANSFIGTVTVQAGQLSINNDAELGDTSNSVTLNGGTLRLSNNINISNSRTINLGAGGGTFDVSDSSIFGNTVAGSAPFTKTGDGDLLLGGATGYNTVNLNQGTLSIINESEFLVAPNVNFNGGALRTATSFTSGGGHNFNFNGSDGTINTSGHDVNLTTCVFSGAGTFHKSGAGNLTTNGVSVGGLDVAGGALTVSSGRNLSKLSTVGNLTVGASAKLDLNDNDLVYDYAGGASAARLANVRAQLTAGYNNGAWNGANGITSSVAASNASSAQPTTLGYAEASSTGLANFDGVTPDADMILIRYTASGDANLDGTVGTTDFTFLAQNFNKSSANWVNGDFNYDGIVNALDFNVLATNFGQSVSAPPVLGSLVPEPGMICSAFGVAAVLAMRQRRV